MQMCSNGHDEIVYEENLRICPLCNELKTNTHLNEKIETLENEIGALEEDIQEIHRTMGDDINKKGE